MYNKPGILIFAYNTEAFNYVKMAAYAAKSAQRFSNLPITLVTDKRSLFQLLDGKLDGYFESVICTDEIEAQEREFRLPDRILKATWYNKNRMSAYDLSPYDKTFLIDADYLMGNDMLINMVFTDVEFACYDEVHDLTGQGRLNKDRYLGYSQVPMQWATVIYFRKTPFAKAIFDFMKHIKENYQYYANLYAFNGGVYRNDFALSIAVQTLSGYTSTGFAKLPGKLLTLDSQCELLTLNYRNHLKISYLYKDHPKDKIGKIAKTNVHVMNKESLMRLIDAET